MPVPPGSTPNAVALMQLPRGDQRGGVPKCRGYNFHPMPRYFPDLERFTAIAGDHELVPVYRQLLSDHLTPVTAFELLAAGQDHAFLLESVIGNEKIGRYSFI